VQKFCNYRAAFPLFVDLDGNGVFMTLPIQLIMPASNASVTRT